MEGLQAVFMQCDRCLILQGPARKSVCRCPCLVIPKLLGEASKWFSVMAHGQPCKCILLENCLLAFAHHSVTESVLRACPALPQVLGRFFDGHHTGDSQPQCEETALAQVETMEVIGLCTPLAG